MKISRKSIYGARAMIEIALRTEENETAWQQISSIARTTAIPDKFLEQILLTLKKSGLLKSRRGVDGGYALNRPAAEITLEQLVLTLDTPMSLDQEIEDGPDGTGAVFRRMIQSAEDAAVEVLQAKTLQDLAAETRAWRQQHDPGLEFMI
ncbi:MAG: Rrf2 family transcriptional regulator [Verrucomicrobiota bacterium]